MPDFAYNHAIFWDPLEQTPVVQLKYGILRRQYPLQLVGSARRNRFVYRNDFVELSGSWKEIDDRSCTLSLELTNLHDLSIRITRLTFPAQNGLEKFIQGIPSRDVAFLRNGYQSWSTARSYRPKEKPLRPWLQIVSQFSSNMANLPSNIPGIFSSEMYTVISDRNGRDAFLVGQSAGFKQFFYIDFHLHQKKHQSSFFKLTFDFGRQLIKPGSTVKLDPIIFSRGDITSIQDQYFDHIARGIRYKAPKTPLRGYGTWYYYYEHIHPDQILANLAELKNKQVPLSVFQIDDGYQSQVGDWLDLKPRFKNRMKEMADEISRAGYTPGLWIAPFVANSTSQLAKIHPDYILKNEYGRKITAGYNPTWGGNLYYGLDITNPRYEEYLRKVIRTMVHEWGFRFLKCDFLFGACLRTAVHYRFDISRAEVLRLGMDIIRDEAGPGVIIEGCGMPLVPGIGTVDLMRVGPDTGPFWVKHTGKLIRTGAMMGVRNSIRNTFVRSLMHKRLWQNDPDCLMLRKNRTKLSKYERHSHINAIILSGGPVLISDDVRQFDDNIWNQYRMICEMNAECAKGRTIPIDLMVQETPELVVNTSGYLGVFNMGDRAKTVRLDMALISGILQGSEEQGLFRKDRNPQKSGQARMLLEDVWSGEKLTVSTAGTHTLRKMRPHSSNLFRIRKD
ncbi:MAG: alpha-galactosidase [Spirochaetales bacterium]|nr:alpha-galactosidase [Spirochaetales bacterium]